MRRFLSIGLAVVGLALVGCRTSDDPSGTYLNTDWFVQRGIPTAADGTEGDLWLDTETTVLYVKTGGSWTSVGALRGSDGSGWLLGTGAPSASTGSDGDLYLDVGSTDTYRKVNGSWSYLFTLEGASGADGEDGEDGATWLAGNGEPTDSAYPGAVVGDLYLDTDTTKVYRKASTGWLQVATLEVDAPRYVFTPYLQGLDAQLFAVTQGLVGGSELFVAVGQEGTVITSEDGTSWDLALMPPLVAQVASARGLDVGDPPVSGMSDLYGVAYGNGLFVAVGEVVDGTYSVFTSTDSVTWTPVTVQAVVGESPETVTATLYGVSYAGGRFVATGSWSSQETSVVLTSSDGADWDVSLVPGYWYMASSAYSGTTYVVTDWYGDILTSTDGADWASASTIPDYISPYLFSLAYADGAFVAVGRDNNSGAPLILLSTDQGATWVSQDLPLGNGCYLYGVTAGPAGFVVVGSDWSTGGSVVLTSRSGASWSIERWDYPASSVCSGQTAAGQKLYVITRGLAPSYLAGFAGGQG